MWRKRLAVVRLCVLVAVVDVFEESRRRIGIGRIARGQAGSAMRLDQA